MKTVVLTIDHAADLPEGFLKTMEARAYDYLQARGGACGEVTARVDESPAKRLPVKEMTQEQPYSLDGSGLAAIVFGRRE